ncbi:hypothetical protein ACPA9J_03770 [Pseudomonas aeruginosa]
MHRITMPTPQFHRPRRHRQPRRNHLHLPDAPPGDPPRSSGNRPKWG